MTQPTITSFAKSLYEDINGRGAVRCIGRGDRDRYLSEEYGHLSVTRDVAISENGPYCCREGVRQYANAFFAGRKEVQVREILDTLERAYHPWSASDTTVREARAGYIYRTILWAVCLHEATTAYAVARHGRARADGFILGRLYERTLARLHTELRLER